MAMTIFVFIKRKLTCLLRFNLLWLPFVTFLYSQQSSFPVEDVADRLLKQSGSLKVCCEWGVSFSVLKRKLLSFGLSYSFGGECSTNVYLNGAAEQ